MKAEDPNKGRDYQREYRVLNREKVNARERARRREVRRANPERRDYFARYKREHPLTPEQKRKRRIAGKAWYERNRDLVSAQRRARYRHLTDPVYIPESTTSMEVEAEMWIARAEGRDPAQARRDYYSREKGWTARTVLIRSPHSDGPLWDKEKVA